MLQYVWLVEVRAGGWLAVVESYHDGEWLVVRLEGRPGRHRVCPAHRAGCRAVSRGEGEYHIRFDLSGVEFMDPSDFASSAWPTEKPGATAGPSKSSEPTRFVRSSSYVGWDWLLGRSGLRPVRS